jgi:transcriptional regulator with XRE-family HTH domain
MKLKEYLKNQGITTYHFAKAIGMPRTTLEDIVNEKVSLSECKYCTLHKISLYLEIPVPDLVEADGIANYPEEVKTKKRIAKNNQSGQTGVCYKALRGEYSAYIKIWGRNIELGRYKTLEEAIAARRAGEKLKELSNKLIND